MRKELLRNEDRGQVVDLGAWKIVSSLVSASAPRGRTPAVFTTKSIRLVSASTSRAAAAMSARRSTCVAVVERENVLTVAP